MGEYAKFRGQSIKIGTCEDMYYLRADQRFLVTAEHGNVDPVTDSDEIRFRFPFPDEDTVEPGDFVDHDRSFTVWGIKPPTAEEMDHYSTQFKADNGYLVSLPCPESGAELEGVKIGRNGYGGAVAIVQQRFWDGLLVTVCQCKGCGARYRLPTLADAQPLLAGLEAMATEQRTTAERNNTPGNADIADRYDEIARRVRLGYEAPADFAVTR